MLSNSQRCLSKHRRKPISTPSLFVCLIILDGLLLQPLSALYLGGNGLPSFVAAQSSRVQGSKLSFSSYLSVHQPRFNHSKLIIELSQLQRPGCRDPLMDRAKVTTFVELALFNYKLRIEIFKYRNFLKEIFKNSLKIFPKIYSEVVRNSRTSLARDVKF